MERTQQQEIWVMLLYLSLANMGSLFEVGLEAFAEDQEDANELGQLYRDLRDEILGIARTRIVAKRMAREDQEKK